MKEKPIQYKKRIYYNKFFFSIAKALTPIILFFMKTRIKDVKGRIPDKGPLLIAAHHEDLADQFVIGMGVKRRLFWVADTTPFGVCLADAFFINWIFKKLGAIAIDKRNTSRNKGLFSYLFHILNKGEAIVFFPEAYVRYERDNKRFGEFKDGVIRLALEYKKRTGKDIPIYPIGLNYKKNKRTKEAFLNIGKEIYVKGMRQSSNVFDSIKELS